MNINEIYNMDCFVGMPQISTKSIDMILCDLPYGTTQNKWDSVLPLDQLWQHYTRLIKPNGAIVLTAQSPFSFILGSSNLPWFRHEWVWEKEMGTGFLNANRAPLKSHENILVFSPGKYTYNPQKEAGVPYTITRGKNSTCYGSVRIEKYVTVNDGSRYPKTILQFKREKGFHPTQKPVKLFEYLIRTYTNPGELVLDNCIGSGTTAIACLDSGRNYIGFELDEKYYQQAIERIEPHKQLRNFVAPNT